MFKTGLRQDCCTFKVRPIKKPKFSDRKTMIKSLRQILKLKQSLDALPLNDKKRIRLILVWSLRFCILGCVKEKLCSLRNFLVFCSSNRGRVG